MMPTNWNAFGKGLRPSVLIASFLKSITLSCFWGAKISHFPYEEPSPQCIFLNSSLPWFKILSSCFGTCWSSSYCSIHQRQYINVSFWSKNCPSDRWMSDVNDVCKDVDVFGAKFVPLNYISWRFLRHIKTLIVRNMYVCMYVPKYTVSRRIIAGASELLNVIIVQAPSFGLVRLTLLVWTCAHSCFKFDPCTHAQANR